MRGYNSLCDLNLGKLVSYALKLIVFHLLRNSRFCIEGRLTILQMLLLNRLQLVLNPVVLN